MGQQSTGAALRATPASAKNPTGFKSFVFEAKLDRKTIRRTIGDIRARSIEVARTEANYLRVMLDNGTDPRELEHQQVTDKAVKKALPAAHAVTVDEAWSAYLVKRQPHWGTRHYRDHLALTKAAGLPAERGTRGLGVTVAALIHSLVALPLRSLTAPVIKAWAVKEAKICPPSARPAWRYLKAFLSWCAEQPKYAPMPPSCKRRY